MELNTVLLQIEVIIAFSIFKFDKFAQKVEVVCELVNLSVIYFKSVDVNHSGPSKGKGNRNEEEKKKKKKKRGRKAQNFRFTRRSSLYGLSDANQAHCLTNNGRYPMKQPCRASPGSTNPPVDRH